MKETKDKIHLSYKDVEGYVSDIARDILVSDWRPDYIVGIGRGGLLPATLLSQYMKIPMYSLDISLRDSTAEPTSNCWMAEDAFGYVDKEMRDHDEVCSSVSKRKNILIVDDINDTGATLGWLHNDWMAGCLPDDDAWDEIWGNSVRFATLVDNEASDFNIMQYSGFEINKVESDKWIVFPWEDWWMAE